ncbi:hypothetical protein AB1Y20_023592 [Prymnesium parvum]|uniref:PCIF1 WW domain-containing protein n=1 Tax=Prymnesium parvum TaxID=97485 RepID=A0AB34JGU0_PRYPA
MSNWLQLQQRLGKQPSSRPRPPEKAPARSAATKPPAALPAAPAGLLDARGQLRSDISLDLTLPSGTALCTPPRAPADHAEPDAAAEARRLHAVQALAAHFERTVAPLLGGRKWFSHFEAWLWAARAEESCRAGAEPPGAPVSVLPSGVAPRGAASQELELKLIRAGQPDGAARQVCAQLAREASRLASQLAAAAPSAGAGATAVAVEAAAAPAVGHSPIVSLTARGAVVRCSQLHLDKLRQLYTPHRKRKRHATPAAREEAFLGAAFCVLARLAALQGGEPRAGGMQAACPAALFDALRETLGVSAELFASPLNARFPRYCSAAADVDHPFGSLGSFFSVHPKAGGFMANPPFAPALVGLMVQRMEEALREADACTRELCFVVVVPHWPDKECWRAIASSSWTRHTLHIPQARHAYMEGGQHYRASLYRLSNHDSSMFVLQSKEALRKRPVTPEIESVLIDAWLPDAIKA